MKVITDIKLELSGNTTYILVKSADTILVRNVRETSGGKQEVMSEYLAIKPETESEWQALPVNVIMDAETTKRMQLNEDA